MSLSIKAQTPLPNGARFPSAAKSDTLSLQTRIPLFKADSGNLMNYYTTIDSLKTLITINTLDADDIDDTNTTNKFVTASDLTVLSNTSGINTGDQTSIVGITGTKSQFNTALTDGTFLFSGDVTSFPGFTDLNTDYGFTDNSSNWDNAFSWVDTNGANVVSHLTDTTNPHSVTKTQVGLGNVDNTSDLDKPISTATQTALDDKLDIGDDISELNNDVGYLIDTDLNDLATSAPFLEELVPETYLPSTTGNFELYGSYFTYSMVENINSANGILIEGHTINYATFISSNRIDVNLTTSATEGMYDVTLNNGVSATFNDVLQVVNGTVYQPTINDWTNIVNNLDVTTEGAAKITTYNSTSSGEWLQEFDYTKDWSVQVRLARSPLGDVTASAYSSRQFRLLKTSDDYEVFSFNYGVESSFARVRFVENGDPYTGGYLYQVSSEPTYDENFDILAQQVLEMRYTSGVMKFYVDGVLQYTSAVSVTENLKLQVVISKVDVDIKYIDLDDTSGDLQNKIYYYGKNIGLDVADFDGNLDNTITDVQKLAQAVDDLSTGGGGGSVDSVNGETGVVVLDADDIDDSSTTNKFVTSAEKTILSNTSGTNTGDQDISGIATNASDISDLQTNKQDILSEGAFVNGDKTKLDGIEAGAEVNDTGTEIVSKIDSELGTEWKSKISSSAETGVAVELDNPVGKYYNMSSASSGTVYTTSNEEVGGFAKCLINTATEPTVTGGTKISGATWVASTDMYLIIYTDDGTNVNYFFLEK